MGKKGVSPVIATVLLVLIAVVLAGIIMIWATNFIGEKAQKDGEAIENSCGRISFEAEALSSQNIINVVNRGNVPIYGFEIRKKGLGNEISIGLFEGDSNTIEDGENGEISLSESSQSVSQGDVLVIAPIILGEFGDETKAYTCENSESTKEITVR